MVNDRDLNNNNVDLNNNIVGDAGTGRRRAGGRLGHQDWALWDREDPGHIVWRRSGPVERLPTGMWRRLTGRLIKIIYPTI